MASPTLPTGAFANAQAIYQGLLNMGLNANAAAGVAGNIYQESHGNPDSSSSAGGGLFGLTVGNGGTVNGGTLAQQLASLQAYIAKNGSISDINSHASSPVSAADWFSNQYERPGIPALSNREDAALWVAQQFGKLGPAAATTTGITIPNPLGAINPFGASGLGGSVGSAIAGPIESIGNDFVKAFFGALGVNSLKDLLQRLALILLGVVLIIVGINQLSKTGGSPINVTTSSNTDESTGYTTKSRNVKTPVSKSTNTTKSVNESHYSNTVNNGGGGKHKGGHLVKAGEGGLASDAIKAAAVA